MAVGIAIAGWRGIWLWGWTHLAMINLITTSYTEALIQRDKLIEADRLRHQKEMTKAQEEIEFWRDISFQVTDIGKKLANHRGRRGRMILTKPR